MPVFVNWKWWSLRAPAAAGGPTKRGWASSQALCCNRREKVPLPREFTLSANKACSGTGIASFIYRRKTKSHIKNLKAVKRQKAWNGSCPTERTGFTQLHASTPLHPHWVHLTWAHLRAQTLCFEGKRVPVTLQRFPPPAAEGRPWVRHHADGNTPVSMEKY